MRHVSRHSLTSDVHLAEFLTQSFNQLDGSSDVSGVPDTSTISTFAGLNQCIPIIMVFGPLPLQGRDCELKVLLAKIAFFFTVLSSSAKTFNLMSFVFYLGRMVRRRLSQSLNHNSSGLSTLVVKRQVGKVFVHSVPA